MFFFMIESDAVIFDRADASANCLTLPFGEGGKAMLTAHSLLTAF